MDPLPPSLPSWIKLIMPSSTIQWVSGRRWYCDSNLRFIYSMTYWPLNWEKFRQWQPEACQLMSTINCLFDSFHPLSPPPFHPPSKCRDGTKISADWLDVLAHYQCKIEAAKRDWHQTSNTVTMRESRDLFAFSHLPLTHSLNTPVSNIKCFCWCSFIYGMELFTL